MIVKQREEPIELYQLQALYKRLPYNHPKKEKVLQDLKRKNAEINGVRAIDFPLGFIEEGTLILHNVRIPDENGFFQIDILLLAPNCIIILEVKNWYGTILFEDKGQVIRINDNEEEEGFPNPISQVKLQRYRLQRWLYNNGYLEIPIYFLVVLSFPSTIIKTINSSVALPDEIIHSNQLIFKLQNMICSSEILQPPHILNALARELVKAHVQPISNPLEKYGIDASELMRGVFCNKCTLPTMVKNYRNWRCKRCNYKSKDAYFKDIRDYKLLINDVAGNKELREFLGIKCKHKMKRLLQNRRFQPIGDGAKRKYRLLF